MITGDHDKLKDIAKFNVCAVHKTPLEVAWYGAEKTWVLRCGHDHYPDAVTRALSLTEEVKSRRRGYVAGKGQNYRRRSKENGTAR